MNRKMILVEFNESWSSYARGDCAAFPEWRALELLRMTNKGRLICKKVGKAKAPPKVEEPGGPKPVELMEKRRAISAAAGGSSMERPK